MAEANMQFSVDHPQLEHAPGAARMGLKRFVVRKNDTSPAFVIGDCHTNASNGPTITPAARLQGSSLSPCPDGALLRLKQELRQTKAKLERLELSHKLAVSRSFDGGVKRPARLERCVPAQKTRMCLPSVGVPDWSKTPVARGKFFLADSNGTSYFDDSKKRPLFAIPRYTKTHPKIVRNNPITGLVPESLG